MKLYIFDISGSFEDETTAFANKKHAIKYFNNICLERQKEEERAEVIRCGIGDNGSNVSVSVVELTPTKKGIIHFFNVYGGQ